MSGAVLVIEIHQEWQGFKLVILKMPVTPFWTLIKFENYDNMAKIDSYASPILAGVKAATSLKYRHSLAPLVIHSCIACNHCM